MAAWLVALFVAWHFSDMIEPHLGGLLPASYVGPGPRASSSSRSSCSRRGLGAIMGHYVRLSIFSGIDRFLGFLFGAARGLVLIGVFVILGQLLKLDGEPWWRHSMLLPYGHSVANGLRVLVGADS